MKFILSLFYAMAVLFSGPSLAQQWQAESRDYQVAVLEMFTSEGCGKCPAAEHFVNHLPEQHQIDDDALIVLGFHIDYLNERKGWVDRFAKPAYSDRQRKLARLNLEDVVYTPELIVSGEVVHNWRQHLVEVVEFINDFEAKADLRLRAAIEQNTLQIDADIAVRGDNNRQNGKAFLALIEDDVKSVALGGDNAGRHFNHQNLVRAWLGPLDLDAAGQSELQETITLDPNWDTGKLELVALVQNMNDGLVLQGLSLPLDTK